MADNLTAKGSFLVVDPKTGENHVIEKGEVRSPRHKLVKLAPWAYGTPEPDEDESIPISKGSK